MTVHLEEHVRLRLAAAATLLALAATACGGATTSDGTTTRAPDGSAVSDEGSAGTAGTAATDDSTADAPQATTAPAAEAVAALDWQTIDTNEVAIDGRDFAGQDVVLWIWAPWCSVCNREAPEIRPVLAERTDELVLLGLAGKDSLEAHRGFVDQHDLGFLTHVVDQDDSIWTKYGVGYQPAFVFINDDGRVAVHAGPIGAEGLDSAIDQLLAT